MGPTGRRLDPGRFALARSSNGPTMNVRLRRKQAVVLALALLLAAASFWIPIPQKTAALDSSVALSAVDKAGKPMRPQRTLESGRR